MSSSIKNCQNKAAVTLVGKVNKEMLAQYVYEGIKETKLFTIYFSMRKEIQKPSYDKKESQWEKIIAEQIL